MNAVLLFIPCMLCAIFVGVTQSSIISQSSITRCEWGDESEPSSKEGKPCEKKLLVSVTLKGGQVSHYAQAEPMVLDETPSISFRVKQNPSMRTLTRLTKKETVN